MWLAVPSAADATACARALQRRPDTPSVHTCSESSVRLLRVCQSHRRVRLASRRQSIQKESRRLARASCANAISVRRYRADRSLLCTFSAVATCTQAHARLDPATARSAGAGLRARTSQRTALLLLTSTLNHNGASASAQFPAARALRASLVHLNFALGQTLAKRRRPALVDSTWFSTVYGPAGCAAAPAGPPSATARSPARFKC